MVYLNGTRVMKILKPGVDPDKFLQSLSSSKNRLLLLDYDGTIAPFRIRREKAYPYDGIRPLLKKIQTISGCRLIIITGRTASELATLIKIDPSPEIWGCHGWERLLPDGSYIKPELDPATISGLKAIAAWSEGNDLGMHFEIKTASVAIHWRGLPKSLRQKIIACVEKDLPPIAAKSGLILKEFNGGIEILPAGRNKGYAVRKILDESGDTPVVAYFGDDMTDEHAFRAIDGHGLSILVNASLRETSADLWIKPPGEILAFFQSWIDYCGLEQ